MLLIARNEQDVWLLYRFAICVRLGWSGHVRSPWNWTSLFGGNRIICCKGALVSGALVCILKWNSGHDKIWLAAAELVNV